MKSNGVQCEGSVSRSTMKKSGGFTLVELMVVVAIIAILASIGIPKMTNFIRASQSTEAVQQMGRIAAGLEAYGDLKSISTSPRSKLLSAAGTNTLTAIVPAIVIDEDANFNYKVEGYGAGAATFCISATGIDSTDPYYILYSKTVATTDGWDDHFNTSDYILKTPVEKVILDGDCVGAPPSVTQNPVTQD
jgi:prepilin-type N-terminal cleavage/methylation domain-containing protein